MNHREIFTKQLIEEYEKRSLASSNQSFLKSFFDEERPRVRLDGLYGFFHNLINPNYKPKERKKSIRISIQRSRH